MKSILKVFWNYLATIIIVLAVFSFGMWSAHMVSATADSISRSDNACYIPLDGSLTTLNLTSK